MIKDYVFSNDMNCICCGKKTNKQYCVCGAFYASTGTWWSKWINNYCIVWDGNGTSTLHYPVASPKHYGQYHIKTHFPYDITLCDIERLLVLI
jgi:hypothetical protein